MRFYRTPCFSTNPPGPWGVDCTSSMWCIVHGKRLTGKVIGPVGSKRKNYFDIAMAEAERRNKKEQA